MDKCKTCEQKDRFAVEYFNRLIERAEQNKKDAELDVKILKAWKETYLGIK